MTKILPQWVHELALLVESVETVRPPGARLAARRNLAATLFQKGLQRRSGGLHAGAHGTGRHRDGTGLFGRQERLPTDDLDRPDHVNFDVVADARVVRIGRNTSFGRVMLLNAADRRYAVL